VSAVAEVDTYVLHLLLAYRTIKPIKVASTNSSAVSGGNYVTNWYQAAPGVTDRRSVDLLTWRYIGRDRQR